jgi:LacI family transcriptional regulator
MVTMRDVARAAGTSVATVSHVLNETRFVSPELRARVEEALRALEYRPDDTARSLRRRSTHTIGLLVPDNSNPFFASLARRIEDEAFRAGYTTFLGNSNEQRERELEYLETLLSKRVDALIIAATRRDDGALQEVLRRFTGPVVFIDRAVELCGRDAVVFDNEGGGRLVAEHLLALGHRELACIGGPPDVPPTAARLAGFLQALAEAGVRPEAGRVVHGDFRYDGGAAAARSLLSQSPGFTALFVVNDLMAAGAVEALLASGQRVPDAISVVGYDDALPARLGSPQLTTVRQPVEAMVEHAVGRLLARLRSDEALPTERLVLPVELVVRGSSAQVSTTRSEVAMG